ncbi:metabotropic glycine receptor [Paramormyrops kingsleyae]|uniref:metabotropic glycine receptor n=1 Tax=Paramormyrops kingsleyae TaxID=1676925 RepID=UPI003B96D4AC
MSVFLISLLLQMGFVVGSNYGYVEWSDQDSDSEIRGKYPVQSTHVSKKDPPQHPTYFFKPVTERPVLAHKIEEDLPRVVTAFLHTGDSATLKQAPCSRRYELSSLRGASPVTPHHSLHGVLDTVAHAANFLNMILQGNRSREHSLRRDIHWYHALVQSMLEGDPKIHRAVVTFSTESSLPSPNIFLQATRMDSEIVLQDLSNTSHHYLKNKTSESEWFSEFRDKKKPHSHRRVTGKEANPSAETHTRGDGYIFDKTQIKWSAPFLECENGNFIPHWLLTLSAGFYGLKPNLAPEFRGVVRVDVNLQDVDIDQCSSTGWFGGTHRCNLTTMECQPLLGHGFVLDKYRCHCRNGFYHPSRLPANGDERREKAQGASTKPQAEGTSEGVLEGAGRCLPCREGCTHCKDDTPCLVQEDSALRLAAVSFQGLCMGVAIISMLLVYHFRRSKRIKASGLVLLEAILSGSLVLYFPVMILYFQPSIFLCVLLRWARLLGFATVYGTVILKLYRVLKVFLSRTAQRIPYMTSWRVLRLLGIILLVVCWFLVAWTLAAFQNMDRGRSLIDMGLTPDGQQFSLCLLDRWDYMMAVAELVFLLWGVYLCYAVRTVPSAFHEPRYMAVAIYNELTVSGIFHVIRFMLAPGLHPDWMLMLFFTHTQLTVTVTLGLLLVPKFLFAGAHTRDDIATEAYEDELDMGRSGSYLNSSITSAWSEHSLDPEDIREELKKLYAQLEIYKRKKMLANNPHLQKKRSSKKGLGRSLMRRITEIPETMSRQCSRDEKDPGDHGSNRNSLCTLRRNPFDPSHSNKSKEDSLKNKVFSLKKSHSYDHVRDQNDEPNSSANDQMEVSTMENSLLDTLMGKTLGKKSPEKAEGESTESVPLVCKSASAHNLTLDKKPVHLRTSMLQKSLSVITSAKEKTLGLTGKTQTTEDGGKKGVNKNKDNKVLSEINESAECYPKMIISQSVEYRQTANKIGIMKHQVSGSQPSICSESGRSKELYDLSEVCPWEVEDLPTPSENKVQKHVSIAPDETTTIHGSGTKGKLHQKLKVVDQSPSNSKRSSQKTTEKSAATSREEVIESRGLRKGMKPLAPLSLTGSAPQSADVCPWDFEEPRAKAETARSPDIIRRKKSVTPTEGKGKTLHSDHSKSTGSLLQSSTMRADICPWDFDGPPSPDSEKAPSPPHVSKGKDSHSKRKGTSSSKTSERDKEKSKDKDDEKRRSKSKDKGSSSRSTEKRRISQSKVGGGCVSDVECTRDSPVSERRRSSTNGQTSAKSKSDFCPWDFEDTSYNKEEDRSPSTGKQNTLHSKPVAADGTKVVNVCPWDFDDTMSEKNA